MSCNIEASLSSCTIENSLYAPGTKFMLNNDNSVYELIGYNDNTTIVYRLVDSMINNQLYNTTICNIYRIIDEPRCILNTRTTFKFN